MSVAVHHTDSWVGRISLHVFLTRDVLLDEVLHHHPLRLLLLLFVFQREGVRGGGGVTRKKSGVTLQNQCCGNPTTI